LALPELRPEVSQADGEVACRYRAREAVALFDDYDDLVDAIGELELAGFDRVQIKVMRSCKAVERLLGHPIKDMRELEDEPRVPLGGWVDRYELSEGKAALAAGLAYLASLSAIGVTVARGGELAAVISAAAGAGGAAGALGLWLMRLAGRRRARELKEQKARGGHLLWVETRSSEQERRALCVLLSHCTRDVRLHDIPR
jgi:hypothetical protein